MRMESRIALQNMKYHKSKNILIGIAIFLTTLLLFLVPTIGKDMIGAQYAVVNEIYPSWHALFRDVDTDTVKKLSVCHDIGKYGLRSDVGNAIASDAEISLTYLDKNGFELYNMELAEGKLPERENEIVLSRGLLLALGQTGEVGDTVSIPYQVYRDGTLDYEEKKDFVISGFVADSDSNSKQKVFSGLISKAFLQAEIPETDISYRFLFQTKISQGATTDEIESTIGDIADQFGISEQDTRINDDYLMANYVDPTVLPAIIGIMCIIVLAGVITIYSIYYIGMSDRIQEFGRLKALGATKKQLKKIVLGEGLLVACISIPIGLLMGSLLTKVVFYLLLNMTQNTNEIVDEMKLLLQNGEISLYHFSLYFLTIGITLLTVWVSLMKPMRIASRVSEIEAIRFQSQNRNKAKKQKRKRYSDLTIFRIVKIYMTGNKRNTLLTIGAMSMTGIFVMVVASVLSCANPIESANNSILGQYEISNIIETGNKEHPEREWKNVIQKNPLNEELIQKIKSMEGITNVVSFQSMKVTCDKFDNEPEEITGIPEQYARDLLDGIVEGQTTYDELKSGDKVIVEKNLLHWYPDIKVGDTLQLQIMDGIEGHTKNVTVVAIGDYPIGFTNYNYLLMADAGTQKICNYNINGTVHIFASESYNKDTENALKKLVAENELLQLETWKENYDEWKMGLSMTNGACYAFLGILGAICVMNMVNTMIHSIHLRKKEIGMMQAIGMSASQLRKMLQFEGLFYTIGTLLLSVGGGSLLGYPVFLWAKKNDMFNIVQYHYPVAAAVIVSLTLLIIQMILAIALSKSVKKESLIERIRYSE